jgi:hypothetical protein
VSTIPPNAFFPDATVPGNLVNVDFMVKDSKRFADSGGWGYAVFDYDSASDPISSSATDERFGRWYAEDWVRTHSAVQSARRA